MVTHIALLRAVNVGGTGRLPMAGLISIAAALGAVEPRTYIQSGNLVFELAVAPSDPPGAAADFRLGGIAAPRPVSGAAFAAALEAAIADQYGFRSPVVWRTRAEWAAVLAASPFPDDGTLHVGFLRDLPAPDRVAALDPDRSPPDQFVVRGREIYLSLPGGTGKSKLSNAWFDRQLEVVSTWRNARTIAAIQRLAER